MFKRFLKFFRGEAESPEEPFEGSYLDHLLGKIQPTVVEQLEECPEHDPLLLVVAGLLRNTMINAWSPRVRCPLTDSQSPGGRTHAPVPPDELENPAAESDQTNEFDTIEAPEDASDAPDEDSEPADSGSQQPEDDDEAAAVGDLDEESSSASEDSDAESGETDDEDSDAESSEADADSNAESTAADTGDADAAGDDEEDRDDDAPDEEVPPDPPEPRSNRKTEEIDVEEVRQASMRRDAEEHGSVTETAEIDRAQLERDPTVEIEKESLFEQQDQDDVRPRLDSEEVLQAGRVFLGLLIENDRLPTELQLTVAETTLARDLLLGYFVGHDDFEEKARQLLTLVEQKFGEGLFSQARILLQLFHTDEQTRINNDRNLFYEDMILRLGIRRRHRMSPDELRRFESLLASVDSAESAAEVCEWLSDKTLIKFHAFNRDPRQVDSWTDVLDSCEREGSEENFLRYLPPRRWRPIGQFDGLTPVDQMRRHVSEDTARKFVIAQLKTCYFVLRAVGDTGLEGFLDTFFDWSEDVFGINGTQLMPELYQRSMMDPEPMVTILEELYEDYFAEPTRALLDGWDDDDVEQALYDALGTLSDCDLGEVAPGYYDLGAFVYDQLFDVEYPMKEFPFKVHRLT